MDKLRCPICRSRRWRREPSSGMLVCGEGHVLQSYRNETTELTEKVGYVLRERKIKDAKPATRRERANPAFYHGTRARFLYFQAIQLLLRLQISALRKLWELPVEFEAICKDVWSLHLAMLQTPLISDTLSEIGDYVPAKEPPTREAGEGSSANPEKEDVSDPDQSPYSSDDEKTESDDEPQNDLADLLEGLSDDGSDGEEEVGGPGAGSNQETERARANEDRKKANPLTSKYTRPSSTLAVLMTACWMFRLPVIYADFIQLINNYTLPYLNVVTRGLMPQSMREHMNKSVVASLNVKIPPRPLKLHALSSRLARKLKEMYKIEVPEANAPHILSRGIDALHLSAVFYHMAKVFADMLRVPLTLHPSLSRRAINSSGKSLIVQIGDNIPVEMSLISTVVLLLKLLYGLDGRSREPEYKEEFLPGLPQQEEFLQRLRREDQRALAAETRTAMDLTPAEIDQYLDFCTRALLGRNMRSQDPLLEKTFPISTLSDPQQTFSPWPATAEEPDDSFPSRDVVSQEPERLLRGKHHIIYSTNDILGDLPEDYRLVVSQAARWCGVMSDDIALVVERFERRLLRDLERGPKSGPTNLRGRHEYTNFDSVE